MLKYRPTPTTTGVPDSSIGHPDRPSRIPRVTGLSGSGLGFGGGVVATCVGSITGQDAGLGLLAGVALVVGASTTLLGALASSVQCWALYCGFLENRFGVLTTDSSSVWALSFLLIVGVLASALALIGRTVGSWVTG